MTSKLLFSPSAILPTLTQYHISSTTANISDLLISKLMVYRYSDGKTNILKTFSIMNRNC